MLTTKPPQFHRGSSSPLAPSPFIGGQLAAVNNGNGGRGREKGMQQKRREGVMTEGAISTHHSRPGLFYDREDTRPVTVSSPY